MSLPRADVWTDPGPIDRPPRLGRRVLATSALALAAMAGVVLIWRATSLRGIPDLGEPFDVKASGTVAVPESENAFTYYRRAVAEFRDETGAGGPYLSWNRAPSRDREWLFANAGAMELWLLGTSMDRALDRQPKDLALETSPAVVRALRRMLWLDQLAGLRMEGAGDLDEAWAWYRAGLRSGRHCGMHGGFIDRMIGANMYTLMDRAVLGWADNPNQSASNLRRALDDLIAVDAMTPTHRENLRAEYVAFARFLDEPGLSLPQIERVVGGLASEPARKPLEALNEACRRFFLREPARSRRVNRLVWANWLSVADLPAAERIGRGHKLEHGYFYDPPADAPESVRRLTPAALDRWVGSTDYLRALLPPVDALDKAEEREAVARAALLVDLAERLYARENGHRPDSPDRLVGPYLKALPEGYVRPKAE